MLSLRLRQHRLELTPLVERLRVLPISARMVLGRLLILSVRVMNALAELVRVLW